mmetsp:Transcript_16723/g.42762  ORF Transcript_16723/g.42762 Transcript_16723/m.42762 type:complete len:418 (+) Transcript_16723:70-1323(+)
MFVLSLVQVALVDLGRVIVELPRLCLVVEGPLLTGEALPEEAEHVGSVAFSQEGAASGADKVERRIGDLVGWLGTDAAEQMVQDPLQYAAKETQFVGLRVASVDTAVERRSIHGLQRLLCLAPQVVQALSRGPAGAQVELAHHKVGRTDAPEERHQARTGNEFVDGTEDGLEDGAQEAHEQLARIVDTTAEELTFGHPVRSARDTGRQVLHHVAEALDEREHHQPDEWIGVPRSRVVPVKVSVARMRVQRVVGVQVSQTPAAPHDGRRRDAHPPHAVADAPHQVPQVHAAGDHQRKVQPRGATLSVELEIGGQHQQEHVDRRHGECVRVEGKVLSMKNQVQIELVVQAKVGHIGQRCDRKDTSEHGTNEGLFSMRSHTRKAVLRPANHLGCGRLQRLDAPRILLRGLPNVSHSFQKR